MSRSHDLGIRRRMYEDGASDVEIAAATGAKHNTVTVWRRKANLPVNSSRHQMIESADDEQRRALYDAGLNDTEIGLITSRDRVTIRLWRKRRALPTNYPTRTNANVSDALGVSVSEFRHLCVKLLMQGIGARLICRETGACANTVNRWRAAILSEHPELRRPNTSARRALRHPSGRLYSKLLPERRRKAFLLYAQGKNDLEIAEMLGINRKQIWEWRHALFLPPIGSAWRKHLKSKKRPPLDQPITALSNPTHAHIMEAIGRTIAPDLADDAASDMWLAIMEGRLSVADVAARANAYRNRIIATYASRFGARSLDEEIGAGDGFRMIDMIRDERSSSWLEEMGATVW